MVPALHKVLTRCKQLAADPFTGKQPTNRQIVARARELGATFADSRVSEWLRGSSRPELDNVSYFLEALGLTFHDFARAIDLVEAADSVEKALASPDEEALEIVRAELEKKAAANPSIAAEAARILAQAEVRAQKRHKAD